MIATNGRAPALAALATAAVLLAPTASGCSSARPTRPAPAHDKVTYLTGFGTFGREGFAWVAREKGFFADAGIDVDIQPGAAGDANLRLLAAGRAQFAIIDYSGALVRAGTGVFHQYKLVGVVTRQTLIAVMALEGAGVVTPRDLAGKTIAQAAGAVPKTLFGAYARLAGFDPTGVRWLETTPQQLPPLLARRKVDAIGQFVVGEPAIRHAADGHPIVTLPYGDYLTDLYGNVVVAPTALISANPDLVRRFTRALLKGLRYAVDHPQETADILHRAAPAVDTATATAEVTLLRNYVGIGTGPLGGGPGGSAGSLDISFAAFDAGRVARGIALMQSLRLIPAAVTPEDLVNFDTMAGGSPR